MSGRSVAGTVTGRRGRARWIAAVAAAIVVSSAPAAWGHASGELPTARLHSEGPVVTVEYQASPDDAAAIGTRLGYLGEGAMVALLGGPSDDLPTDEQVARFSRSPALRAYLQDHIAVIQDGQRCAGHAEPAEDFLAGGAVVEFRCPETVEQARIRITVLHDEDRAYRTFSVDGTSQYAIHTVAAPEHPWDFTLAAADRSVDPVLLVGAAMLALGLAGGLGVRFRRRRAAS